MLRQILKFSIISSFLIASIGCEPSETKKVDDTATTKAENKATQPPAPPKPKDYKLGDTVQAGQWQVKLNKVRYTSVIKEKSNQFMTAKADKGDTFAIVDITVINASKEQQVFSSMMAGINIQDSEGYTYAADFGATMNLKKAYKDGAIPPSGKSRGELAIKLPTNSKV